jgi:hypothetical protein
MAGQYWEVFEPKNQETAETMKKRMLPSARKGSAGSAPK